MPVYMQVSILELPYIYINGGRRGFLVKIASSDLQQVLQQVLQLDMVDVAI